MRTTCDVAPLNGPAAGVDRVFGYSPCAVPARSPSFSDDAGTTRKPSLLAVSRRGSAPQFPEQEETMSFRDLIPWRREEGQEGLGSLPGSEMHPLLSFHREMNRMFDDLMSRFDMPMGSFGRRAGWSWPNIELAETASGVKVTAEIPGMEQKDVEVMLDGDVLVLSGEKKSEETDENRRFSERFYGRFERRIQLPFEVDEEKTEAKFANGVLTVTLPKSPRAQARARKIQVNGTSPGTQH